MAHAHPVIASKMLLLAASAIIDADSTRVTTRKNLPINALESLVYSVAQLGIKTETPNQIAFQTNRTVSEAA
jgi:hypothetical protein